MRGVTVTCDKCHERYTCKNLKEEEVTGLTLHVRIWEDGEGCGRREAEGKEQAQWPWGGASKVAIVS